MKALREDFRPTNDPSAEIERLIELVDSEYKLVKGSVQIKPSAPTNVPIGAFDSSEHVHECLGKRSETQH